MTTITHRVESLEAFAFRADGRLESIDEQLTALAGVPKAVGDSLVDLRDFRHDTGERLGTVSQRQDETNQQLAKLAADVAEMKTLLVAISQAVGVKSAAASGV